MFKFINTSQHGYKVKKNLDKMHSNFKETYP